MEFWTLYEADSWKGYKKFCTWKKYFSNCYLWSDFIEQVHAVFYHIRRLEHYHIRKQCQYKGLEIVPHAVFLDLHYFYWLFRIPAFYTGYEKELFKRQNEKRATETEAYLWSVSDMWWRMDACWEVKKFFSKHPKHLYAVDFRRSNPSDVCCFWQMANFHFVCYMENLLLKTCSSLMPKGGPCPHSPFLRKDDELYSSALLNGFAIILLYGVRLQICLF